MEQEINSEIEQQIRAERYEKLGPRARRLLRLMLLSLSLLGSAESAIAERQESAQAETKIEAVSKEAASKEKYSELLRGNPKSAEMPAALTPEEDELAANLSHQVGMSYVFMLLEAKQAAPGSRKPAIEYSNFMGYLTREEKMQFQRDIEKLSPRARLNINKFQYIDEFKPMDAGYGSATARFNASGEAFVSPATISIKGKNIEVGAKTVVFYKSKVPITQEMKVIKFHEAGHLEDWIANDFLNTHERLELLERVLSRINAADRFHSAYVEEINAEDPQTRNYKRASEYFAEIWNAYFSENKNLPTADREIVQWVIAKMNEK